MSRNKDWLNKLGHIYKIQCAANFTNDSANVYGLIKIMYTV